jgi:prepilin-type N-terminal cleavage/methylation domain-containing protein
MSVKPAVFTGRKALRKEGPRRAYRSIKGINTYGRFGRVQQEGGNNSPKPLKLDARTARARIVIICATTAHSSAIDDRPTDKPLWISIRGSHASVLPLLNQGATPVVKSPRPNGFSLLEILVVLGLIAVLSAIAVPMFGNALADFKLSGDARNVSNAVALSKLRAASDFSRVRLYVDLVNRTHHIESWKKTTSSWTTEGGTTSCRGCHSAMGS